MRGPLRQISIVLLLALIGCSEPVSKPSERVDVEGTWILTSFTEGGVEQRVEVGFNTRAIPWMEITATAITGDGGCNGFGTGDRGYTIEGTELRVGETFFQMAGCMSDDPAVDVMAAEEALRAALWAGKPIEVDVAEEEMEWRAPGVTLTFSGVDEPPPTTTVTSPPYSRIERLDCSPGFVIEDRIPDAGQEPLALLRSVAPGVVRVESGRPLWSWGLDADGVVIAGAALGDMDNADYQVWSCDPPLG